MALPVVAVDQVIEVHANELTQRVEAVGLESCKLSAPADVRDIEAHNAPRQLPVLLHVTASNELRRQRGSGLGRITRDRLSQRRYARSRCASRHARKRLNRPMGITPDCSDLSHRYVETLGACGHARPLSPLRIASSCWICSQPIVICGVQRSAPQYQSTFQVRSDRGGIQLPVQKLRS